MVKLIDKTLPKVFIKDQLGNNKITHGKIKRNLDTQANIDFWNLVDSSIAQREKEEESLKILNELGIVSLSAADILDLLKDDIRLKEIVSKLKLKVFW